MKIHLRHSSRALLCGLLILCPVFSSADDTQTLLQIADQHIIPAYDKLAVSTALLQDKAKAFCAAPAAEALEAMRTAFHQAMDDWQAIQHIRFGPVEYLLRGPRFQLWPDTRGAVGKHLAQLLASTDPSALESLRFARGSVAVQGFSALEILLFDTRIQTGQFDASDAGRFRCAVIEAITGNLAHMAAGIETDWVEDDKGHRQYFATAATGNDYYENAREALSKILNNLHTQLQFIVEQKLDRPLGSTVARANGRRAESWRGSRSLRNIRRNLRSLQALYRVAFAAQITDPELAGRIAAGFDEALRRLEQVPPPLHEAVTNPAARQATLNLRTQISELQGLFAGPVPQALDLSLGFNSLDGD
jgi:predicted lipoprotein